MRIQGEENSSQSGKYVKIILIVQNIFLPLLCYVSCKSVWFWIMSWKHHKFGSKEIWFQSQICVQFGAMLALGCRSLSQNQSPWLQDSGNAFLKILSVIKFQEKFWTIFYCPSLCLPWLWCKTASSHTTAWFDSPCEW